MLRAAQLYRLRQYQQCVDLLTPLDPLPCGGSRLLGLSHGLLQDAASALPALMQAWREEPADALVRASLLSAACATEAEIDGDEVLGTDPEGPLAEVGGAWCWRQGRRELQAGRHRAAGLAFTRSTLLFARGPEDTAGERLSAALVGRVIAYLLAGEFVPARSAYASCPRRSLLPQPALTFLGAALAAAEELAGLSHPERAEVLEPLAEVVTRARLSVRFFDQERPVSMHWDNLL